MASEDRPLKRDDNPSAAKYVGTILLISFVLFFLFLPVWPYAIAWGYYPAAGFAAIFLLALFFLVIGAAGRKQGPQY